MDVSELLSVAEEDGLADGGGERLSLLETVPECVGNCVGTALALGECVAATLGVRDLLRLGASDGRFEAAALPLRVDEAEDVPLRVSLTLEVSLPV